MKKLLNFSLLAILAASFVVTGCKKDDDSNPGGETTKQDGILPKKVVKIVKNYVGHEDYGDTYLFDAEGRITSYTEKEGKYSDITTYTYTEDKCVCVYDNGEKTLTINVENGRFVSWSKSTGNKGEYSYTSDGYIKSQKWDDTEGTENIEYTVTDGNITSYIDHYVEKYENNEYIHDENTTLTYGNKLNNLNVDIVPIICYLDLDPGCCGKRCKNLPTSISSIYKTNRDDEQGSNRTELEEYTYTYDGDYLTKVTKKNTDSDGVSERIYEIYYED
ncbi:MAG: hypothetical protein PUC50_04615 [Bacteroidales bacterium]|nr:hypothetical protein [Bacteroidales bacterium]